MSSTWSSSKKWWMDILKSIITFALFASVTASIIDRINEQQSKARSQADAEFQLRLDAMKDFRSATIKYEVSADLAFSELLRWDGATKPQPMLYFENDAFASWRSAVEDALLRQSASKDLSEKLEGFSCLVRDRRNIYQYLVNHPLDKSAVYENVQKLQSLSQDISRTRAEILQSLEYYVLNVPRDR